MIDTIFNAAGLILLFGGFSVADILTTAFKVMIGVWSIGILLVLPASIRALLNLRRVGKRLKAEHPVHFPTRL